METELQKIYSALESQVTSSPVVSSFIHYWIDEEGGCDERPSKPSGERLNVSYYDPCDAEDQAEIDRVMKVIKTAISESPVSIYQNYYNEDEGEEWIDDVFARGVHATEWGVDY